MKFKKGIKNAFKFRFEGKQRNEPTKAVEEHQSDKQVSEVANDERNVREENEAVGEIDPAENATSERTAIRSDSEKPETDQRESPKVKSSRSDVSTGSLWSKKSHDKSVKDNKTMSEMVPIEPEAGADQVNESACPPAEEASTSANPTSATVEAKATPEDCTSVSAKATTLCGLSLCLG
jgi:hypothetical protein